MNKILGIFGLLVFVCLFTAVLSSRFDTAVNLSNVTSRTALFGIISIGVAFVIITGGIDLSIGSVICLIGVILSRLIMDWGWSVPWALAMVMSISLALGLLHGLLITKLKLQPFVVTLCGLLVYRGFARWFAADKQQGFGQEHNDGLRQLAIGETFNTSTLLMGIGILFIAFFGLRAAWCWTRKQPGLQGALVGMGFAALFAVSCSSQFWVPGGKSLVLNMGSSKFMVNPGNLMFVTGLLTFVPLAIAFTLRGLGDNLGRTVLPTGVMILSAVLFAFVAFQIAPEFGRIPAGDTENHKYWLLTMKGSSMRNLIMLIVFLATAALMGSIGWLASTVAAVSENGKKLLLPMVTGGVLLMIGMTKLPETMVPMPILILIACTIVASVFLNQTIYGRYLLALGRNEEAARYSGINTDNMIILAYVICAGMAGLGAILFAVDVNNMQPASHGNFYELYAIAGAVLGGCSLRGGEGSIVGVVIGSAVMRVLYNMINTLKLDTKLELVVIGVVILTGVIADEVVKRIVAARRAKLQAQAE